MNKCGTKTGKDANVGHSLSSIQSSVNHINVSALHLAYVMAQSSLNLFTGFIAGGRANVDYRGFGSPLGQLGVKCLALGCQICTR